MTVYADSSLLVSLYLIDLHSSEAQRRMDQRPPVFLTPLHRAEIANAILRQEFYGRFSRQETKLAYSNFEQDCAAGLWLLTEQPQQTFLTSVELTRRHVATLGVRTLDTLHVAAALELKADRFWTFDQRQARLAEAEGLSTA